MTGKAEKRLTSLPPPTNPGSLPLRSADEGRVHELLAFTLGTERYGLPLRAVREIVRMLPLTEVPRAPSDVLGIVSVRGRVTTVIDLRRRLRLPEAPLGKLTRILLVDDGDEVLGLLVDSVVSVYRLREDEIELTAQGGAESGEYVLGIGRPGTGRGVTRGRHEARVASERGELLILLDQGPLLGR